jgi:hypothetical protein
MEKTDKNEVIEDAKIESVSVELEKQEAVIIAECLALAVASLKTDNPSATVAILNVDAKIKEAIK